jgi:hypothetical protein
MPYGLMPTARYETIDYAVQAQPQVAAMPQIGSASLQVGSRQAENAIVSENTTVSFDRRPAE